ncbi:MAG: quinol:cytochrome C oxidoreductase, partial [Bacteroidota bacterium]|nr:quinol:cytochrome C oxidoreductase [Bacteroidota bacterium]
MKTSYSFDEQFEFKGKAKTWSLVMIAVGIIGIAYGFLSGSGERTFANLLLMAYYFACVCICGILFCSIQYVAQSGWSASILRIPQAFAKILPIAAVILLIIICAGLFITHPGLNEEGKQTVLPYLYKQWALKGITTPGNENYNAVITGKSGFLNVPFFLTRLVLYLGCY